MIFAIVKAWFRMLLGAFPNFRCRPRSYAGSSKNLKYLKDLKDLKDRGVCPVIGDLMLQPWDTMSIIKADLGLVCVTRAACWG